MVNGDWVTLGLLVDFWHLDEAKGFSPRMSRTGFAKGNTGIAALIFSVVAGGRIFFVGVLCHFNIIEHALQL
jgi:hypothetical protein